VCVRLWLLLVFFVCERVVSVGKFVCVCVCENVVSCGKFVSESVISFGNVVTNMINGQFLQRQYFIGLTYTLSAVPQTVLRQM
jgi:hypothetical protein